MSALMPLLGAKQTRAWTKGQDLISSSRCAAIFTSRPIAQSWGMPWSIKNLMFHDKPVPLSNQRSLGYKKVWVYCSNPDCRHSAVLDVEHLSDETTFNELMPRMLCTVCDHRGADVTTAWHVPG